MLTPCRITPRFMLFVKENSCLLNTFHSKELCWISTGQWLEQMIEESLVSKKLRTSDPCESGLFFIDSFFPDYRTIATWPNRQSYWKISWIQISLTNCTDVGLLYDPLLISCREFFPREHTIIILIQFIPLIDTDHWLNHLLFISVYPCQGSWLKFNGNQCCNIHDCTRAASQPASQLFAVSKCYCQVEAWP